MRQAPTELTIIPLRAGRPDVPPRVEAAILRALRPAPAERFPDAQAFARALGAGT